MPIDADFMDPDPDRSVSLWLQQALDIAQDRDREAGGLEHVHNLLASLIHWTALTAKAAVQGATQPTPAVPPEPLRLVRPRPNNVPRFGRGVDPAVRVTDETLGIPQAPAALRATCAHRRSLSMGRTGYGEACGLPIVQHGPDGPWVHAGNAVEAARAGRDHAPVRGVEPAETCTDCGQGFASAIDLMVHKSERHHVDHNCSSLCATPCPLDDDNPRGWQG